MQRSYGVFRAMCLGAALACSAAGVGCVHHSHRVYDAYYNDYHRWNDHEIDYYQRWARETHRDPDRDIRKLSPDDQEEYWKWRHNQDDHPRHDHH
ncbi:MAG: hypothetical protein ABSD39_21635 [Terriglobales bacterium]